MHQDRLKPLFSHDAADWQECCAALPPRPTAYWHMDAQDLETAWPIETRPFVLFGEQESIRHGLPTIDCFVYSDTGDRLLTDLSRAYGPPEAGTLCGNPVIFREPPGAWQHDRHPLLALLARDQPSTISVEITQIIPLQLIGLPLPEIPAQRTVKERLGPCGLIYLTVESEYSGDDTDEEFAVLLSPHAPGTVVQILQHLGIAPAVISRTARPHSWDPTARILELAHAVRSLQPPFLHLPQLPDAPLDHYTLHPTRLRFPASPFEQARLRGGYRLYRRSGVPSD